MSSSVKNSGFTALIFGTVLLSGVDEARHFLGDGLRFWRWVAGHLMPADGADHVHSHTATARPAASGLVAFAYPIRCR